MHRKFISQQRCKRSEPTQNCKGDFSKNFQIKKVQKGEAGRSAAHAVNEFRTFINQLEENGSSIESFFDQMREFVDSNRKQVFQNAISVEVFRRFVADSFEFISEESLDGIVRILVKQTSQNFNEEISQKKLDIFELKARFNRATGGRLNTLNLNVLLGAIKLDEMKIDTLEFVRGLGFDVKKKIDFSEVFVICQKICLLNFAESSEIFDKLDFEKGGKIPVTVLANEINNLRKTHFVNENKPDA